MRTFKNYKLLLKILPFLIIVVLLLSVYKKPFSIAKTISESSKLYLTTFGDSIYNGNSNTILIDTIPAISFRYMLGNKVPYPFTGLAFYMRDKSFFNLSAYDHLKIKLKATAGTRLPLVLHSFIPNISKPEDFNSYFWLEYIMLADKQWSEIDISLTNYEVPNWWYGANNITEQDLDKPDFSKVVVISIASCTNLKAGATDKASIKELKFYRDMSPFYIGSFIFIILYFTSWGLLAQKKNRKSKKEITFKYEELEPKKQINYINENDLVFNYITSNYPNHELSVIKVEHAIGIHERKISSIIKKKTDLSFKQFLNKIRIAEAKRLLLESDLHVSEIALKTGYTNPTHFNRVFKSSENCSPNDFRKKHSIYSLKKVISKL